MTANDEAIYTAGAGVETDVTEYDHINLNEIDPTFKAIDTGFYTLQVNRIGSKIVTPGKGKNAGKAVRVFKGSFTVVNDDNYSGRKLWKDFWASNPVDMKDLRRLQDATGQVQGDGQTLPEWAESFGSLNPPAEFKVFVGQEADYRNPENTVNKINFNQSQPV